MAPLLSVAPVARETRGGQPGSGVPKGPLAPFFAVKSAAASGTVKLGPAFVHVGVTIMRVFDRSQVRNWRERAEQCRALADGFHTEAARKNMLTVADEYDRMAEVAERLDAEPPVNRAS